MSTAYHPLPWCPSMDGRITALWVAGLGGGVTVRVVILIASKTASGDEATEERLEIVATSSSGTPVPTMWFQLDQPVRARDEIRVTAEILRPTEAALPTSVGLHIHTR